MPEYISREAARNALYEADAITMKGVAILNQFPAADVVEVRHGRWHRYSKGSGSYNGAIILSDAFQCTVCKKSFWNKSDYCPSCGAKMDGEKGDNQ